MHLRLCQFHVKIFSAAPLLENKNDESRSRINDRKRKMSLKGKQPVSREIQIPNHLIHLKILIINYEYEPGFDSHRKQTKRSTDRL